MTKVSVFAGLQHCDPQYWPVGALEKRMLGLEIEAPYRRNKEISKNFVKILGNIEDFPSSSEIDWGVQGK